MHTDGVTVLSQWPLQHFFDYIFSFDSIVSNLQYPRECQGELWIIVRGDRLPCGGKSWCQMSISFANRGHLARTLFYHWTVNVALCGEKSTSVLSQVWANNLAFLQSALDSGVVPIRGASRRCRIFCAGDSPWLRRLSGVTTRWMAGVCSCTLKYQGGMGTPEATCAMHKNWLTRFGHILRMRNCGSARYLFFSARYMLSIARNDHYRARYAVFKRQNP